MVHFGHVVLSFNIPILRLVVFALIRLPYLTLK